MNDSSNRRLPRHGSSLNALSSRLAVNREKRQWRRYRLSPVKTDKGNPVAGIFSRYIPDSWLIVSTKAKDGDVAHHRADCRVYRRVLLRRRPALVNAAV